MSQRTNPTVLHDPAPMAALLRAEAQAEAAPGTAPIVPSERASPMALSSDDLEALARICLLRLPRRDAETTRATRMREVLAAGAQVARAMTAHTHRLLIHCQGSHGTGDPAEETAALAQALTRYTTLVATMVRDYRWLLEEGAVTVPTAHDPSRGAETVGVRVAAVALPSGRGAPVEVQ